MKNNLQPENDQPLRKVLSEWQVNADLPPRFRERVWERIESKQRRTASGVWMQFASLLTRPRFAVAYMTVFLLIGIGAGCERGVSKTAQVKSDLQARYVQMVDPYQTPR